MRLSIFRLFFLKKINPFFNLSSLRSKAEVNLKLLFFTIGKRVVSSPAPTSNIEFNECSLQKFKIKFEGWSICLDLIK